MNDDNVMAFYVDAKARAVEDWQGIIAGFSSGEGDGGEVDVDAVLSRLPVSWTVWARRVVSLTEFDRVLSDEELDERRTTVADNAPMLSEAAQLLHSWLPDHLDDDGRARHGAELKKAANQMDLSIEIVNKFLTA